jgi:hypothetical protein
MTAGSRATIGIGFAATAWPLGASAGDMDALGVLVVLFWVYCGLVVAAASAALYCCRFIRDRTQRAITRLAIVLLVLTPVPMAQGYGKTAIAPAFLAVLQSLNLAGSSVRNGYAVWVAYAMSFGLFVPLVLAWIRVGRRYGR